MRGARGLFKVIYKQRSAYLFILPSFIFFFIFVLLPVIKGIQLSFLHYNVRPKPSTWVGLANYAEVLKDSIFWVSLRNTLVYASATVFGNITISLIVALMIFPLSGKMQTLYKSAYYLPSVTSLVVIALVWKWIFNPVYGLLNYIVSLFGVEPIAWLASTKTALGSLIFMEIIKGDGACVLLILASLGSIPISLFEAASCDGARKIQQFFKITIPMLKPIILYLVVIGMINMLQVFIPMYVMTRGGPEYSTVSVAYKIYEAAFMRFMRFDIAAAEGVILFIVTIVLSVVYFRLFKSDISY